ncbi:MAG: c-type cytochrome, partial [Gammaproteobacteria bacterium]
MKVPACVACHGNGLTGVAPAIPGLAGLPRDYLNAQLGAWRNGSRRAHAPDCMATIAARLSVADVTAISSYIAAQPVPPEEGEPVVSLPLIGPELRAETRGERRRCDPFHAPQRARRLPPADRGLRHVGEVLEVRPE